MTEMVCIATTAQFSMWIVLVLLAHLTAKQKHENTLIAMLATATDA
jgi:hypothetical protein